MIRTATTLALIVPPLLVPTILLGVPEWSWIVPIFNAAVIMCTAFWVIAMVRASHDQIRRTLDKLEHDVSALMAQFSDHGGRISKIEGFCAATHEDWNNKKGR